MALCVVKVILYNKPSNKLNKEVKVWWDGALYLLHVILLYAMRVNEHNSN